METPLKVLVLGSTGMLGHQVVMHLEKFEKFEVFNLSYKNSLNKKTKILDVTDKINLEAEIEYINPNFIINCIGVLVNASQDIERANYLNAVLPHELKKICARISSKLIHISTDCVFSGKKGLYKENDSRDGKGTYAETKILGELKDKNNLTIRTSIIGPELKSSGEGLFDWFMRQNGEIQGYKNSIWSGVTTLELAKAIKWAIENNINGTYHITNNSVINKYDLLSLFKEYTKKNIEVMPFTNKKVDKSFVDTRRLINYTIPSYEEMISSMVEEIKKNKNLYSRYNSYKSIL